MNALFLSPRLSTQSTAVVMDKVIAYSILYYLTLILTCPPISVCQVELSHSTACRNELQSKLQSAFCLCLHNQQVKATRSESRCLALVSQSFPNAHCVGNTAIWRFMLHVSSVITRYRTRITTRYMSSTYTGIRSVYMSTMKIAIREMLIDRGTEAP